MNSAKKVRPLIILVTGASSGIGASIASAFAEDGHTVFACARRLERLQSLSEKNPTIQIQACDVSVEEEVAKLANWIEKSSTHLDVIINCAGLFGAIGRIDQTNSREWRNSFDINVFGTYLVIKHTLKYLTANPKSLKKIINFSGGGAFEPFPNYSAYAVSKAAVVRLTENISVELAPLGVTALCLAPGFVKTEIHDATLKAGSNSAGDKHFQQTLQTLKEGAKPVENTIECIRCLLQPETIKLTGKTISVNFDPWKTKEFSENIEAINKSELYTGRRMNLRNLSEQESTLRNLLEAAASKK